MSSRAYRLRPEEGTPEGLRRIALGRTERAVERLRGAATDEELAVAIHGARKDLKKLRALLRLVRAELGSEPFEAENRRFRDAGRLLASSRDAEVKLATLRALRERSGPDLPDAHAERWEAGLERERDEAHALAGAPEAAARAIETGAQRIPDWPLETGSWELLAPGLTRTYRDGRQAMKRALAKPSAGRVHRWRKRAKELRYQLQIVQDAWPPVLEATVGQARELGELLGDHHDLAILAEDLGSRGGFGDRGPFETAIVARQDDLLAAAAEIGTRLYAEKPKAFRRRIKRYWRSWRNA